MILYLPIKYIYFIQIKSGKKKEEFRLKTDYWKKKLFKRKYSTVCFRAGYDTKAPTLFIEYLGYKIRTIKHEFFGNHPVKVYAIQLGRIINSVKAR